MKRFIPWTALALALIAAPARGAQPPTMSYQGVLTDGVGNIVPDGSYSITFRIFDDPTLSGPHLKWTEDHDGVTAPQVTVSRGGFSVILGSAIPIDFPFNGPLWLELEVAGDGLPLAPRTELTSSPYSLNTRNVYDGGTSGFVGVGRATRVTGAEYFGVLAPVATGYGGMYIQTQGPSSQPFYGYTTGSAAAWTYLDGNDANKWKVYNSGERLTVTPAGRVGIGTTSPGTTLEVAGGTKLGSDAPAIKTKKLTGTTDASQGGSVNIPHGLDANKILSVSAMVEYSPVAVPGAFVPPAYNYNPGYEFNWYINGPGGSIWVTNQTGNSANILSKPIKILVTYEE